MVERLSYSRYLAIPPLHTLIYLYLPGSSQAETDCTAPFALPTAVSQSVAGILSIGTAEAAAFLHTFLHTIAMHNSMLHWITLLQRFAVDAAAAVVLLVAPFALSFFFLTHFLLSVCLFVCLDILPLSSSSFSSIGELSYNIRLTCKVYIDLSFIELHLRHSGRWGRGEKNLGSSEEAA